MDYGDLANRSVGLRCHDVFQSDHCKTNYGIEEATRTEDVTEANKVVITTARGEKVMMLGRAIR